MMSECRPPSAVVCLVLIDTLATLQKLLVLSHHEELWEAALGDNNRSYGFYCGNHTIEYQLLPTDMILFD